MRKAIPAYRNHAQKSSLRIQSIHKGRKSWPGLGTFPYEIKGRKMRPYHCGRMNDIVSLINVALRTPGSLKSDWSLYLLPGAENVPSSERKERNHASLCILYNLAHIEVNNKNENKDISCKKTFGKENLHMRMKGLSGANLLHYPMEQLDYLFFSPQKHISITSKCKTPYLALRNMCMTVKGPFVYVWCACVCVYVCAVCVSTNLRLLYFSIGINEKSMRI